MIFHYTVEHVPGKLLYTADTLSRAPLESSQADHSQAKAINAHVLLALYSTYCRVRTLTHLVTHHFKCVPSLLVLFCAEEDLLLSLTKAWCTVTRVWVVTEMREYWKTTFWCKAVGIGAAGAAWASPPFELMSLFFLFL